MISTNFASQITVGRPGNTLLSPQTNTDVRFEGSRKKKGLLALAGGLVGGTLLLPTIQGFVSPAAGEAPPSSDTSVTQPVNPNMKDQQDRFIKGALEQNKGQPEAPSQPAPPSQAPPSEAPPPAEEPPKPTLADYRPQIKQAPTVNMSDRAPGFEPIFIIHETAQPLDWTLNRFTDPDGGASSHVVIARDGVIHENVPPDKAAWTAGRSAFKGQKVGNSVNKFAYQVELISPPEGYWVSGKTDVREHSGYTDEQYKAIAWVYLKTNIPPERVTYHSEVDATPTNERALDPRSFDEAKFFKIVEEMKNNPTVQEKFNLGL